MELLTKISMKVKDNIFNDYVLTDKFLAHILEICTH